MRNEAGQKLTEYFQENTLVTANTLFQNPREDSTHEHHQMVNKRVRNAVLGCNLKNIRMISVPLQGKPFNITVIQVYAPTSNAEETS